MIWISDGPATFELESPFTYASKKRSRTVLESETSGEILLSQPALSPFIEGQHVSGANGQSRHKQ